ncbi:chromosome segregation protein SMC [Caminicella sporogenes]|uniref:chromosome segregation protein SMC n=1 Tax=Caminicella sporogenes TaxID=166485 RepID=UPI0025413F17|nr:chromosome segregation protein SMC [Caminicella sporogenes]WIF94613.1 chromosome segregation protein SMC [Caminicella sporogenes]
MYLKKLEIYGFKSFADKIEIDFKKGITGIVGPNGSGKSNIIDAVRWVLGEQSAKTLRGSKMEDVIFNGTSHRRPLGMAEVSLSFDNSDKLLPIDYSEVTITRRIYRSGESEYLINKTPCRLKDIKELLMDTGIGIDGYSLIGQGQIDSILSSKTEDRRQIFEEAAGIVKYKARKAEAEKKLENTCQNIVRINDIIGELESRVKPLKQQSEKAKKYLELSEKLKDLELNLFLNEIEQTENKLKAEQKQLNIVENQLNNYLKNRKNLIEKQEKIQLMIDNIENEIKKMKSNYFEISSTIKKLEGDKILYNEKIQNTENNIIRISKEINELELQKNVLNKQLENLLNERENLEKNIRESTENLKLETEKYKSSTSSLNEDELFIENLKSEVIEILNKISSTKSEISSMSSIKESILKRIRKIQEDNRELKEREDSLNFDIQTLDEELKNINKSILQKQDKKNDFQNRRDELLNKYNNLLVSFEEKKNSLNKCISEKKLLEEMDKSYEGFNSSVKKTLEICKKSNIGNGIHGVVAELMTIPRGLEIAMEVALGYSMQYIVCNKQEEAKRVIKYLKENSIGRVTFLPLSNIYIKNNKGDKVLNLKKLSGVIGRANELINFDKKYERLFEYLLGKVIIVDNIDTAIEISKIIKTYKIVTVDGDVINPSGTITGGSYKAKGINVFIRKRKIEDLNDEIEKLSNTINSYSEKISTYKIELEKLEKKINLNHEEIERLKMLLFKKENSYTYLKNELNNIKSNKSNLKSEYDELSSDLKDIEMSIEKKRHNIEVLEKQNLKLQNDINKKLECISKSHRDLENVKEKITTLKVILASLNEKKENIIAEINRINDSIKTCDDDKLSRKKELTCLEKSKKDYSAKLKEIELLINDNNVLFKQLEYNINKYDSEKTDLLKKNKILVDEIKSINKAINELKESLHKIEVRKTRFELQRDSIVKKIWEKYELSLTDAIKYKKEIEDYSDILEKIKYIKGEIKGLGQVNINSIKEYEELIERYDFLKNQKEDLIKAKESLNKVIVELESTMNKQFLDSFNKINESFSIIFNKLFNGGRAKLILEDKSNVLESNIEIIAQPPGKKLQNLNLLSGGEKALTAIALLFSILKTKPTPFCILDEIEAALDDANIYRFADFLKEFSKNSQFIIITHRKGTMEIIDYLYGVTMQEYGVSKVVSVKLTEKAS